MPGDASPWGGGQSIAFILPAIVAIAIGGPVGATILGCVAAWLLVLAARVRSGLGLRGSARLFACGGLAFGVIGLLQVADPDDRFTAGFRANPWRFGWMPVAVVAMAFGAWALVRADARERAGELSAFRRRMATASLRDLLLQRFIDRQA